MNDLIELHRQHKSISVVMNTPNADFVSIMMLKGEKQEYKRSE